MGGMFTEAKTSNADKSLSLNVARFILLLTCEILILRSFFLMLKQNKEKRTAKNNEIQLKVILWLIEYIIRRQQVYVLINSLKIAASCDFVYYLSEKYFTLK